MKVSDIMTTDVVVIQPDTDLLAASMELTKNNISGVPVVVEGNELVGIATEFDIMKKLIEQYVPAYIEKLAHTDSDGVFTTGDIKIKDIMTTKIYTVRTNDDAIEAARLITKYDINPIPVINEKGRLMGIVSRSDIVKHVADVFPEIEK